MRVFDLFAQLVLKIESFTKWLQKFVYNKIDNLDSSKLFWSVLENFAEF